MPFPSRPLRGLFVALMTITLAACGNRSATPSIAGAAGVPGYLAAATAYTQAPASSSARPAAVVAQAYAANSAGTELPVLTTPPVTIPAQGALALVQVLAQSPATLQAVQDNQGNVYSRLGPMQTYSDQKAGTALFVGRDVKGGPGQTWSLVKAQGHGADEASLYVVVLSGASGIGAWGFSNTTPYGLRTPLETTAAGSIVVSFWGPADYSSSARDPYNPYFAPSGWTLGGQNDNGYNQCSGAYAWVRVAAARTVLDPQWSSKKSVKANGSMWLVEVRR
ncbi:hypothetical protein [Thiomonas intermedia]|uniref:hypothetical protein n=1 Tax=Thiomonas intermedia TaxID=926 RepID=UPI001C54E8EE|nr:hypothetical protein [Thiomonas intermedia]